MSKKGKLKGFFEYFGALTLGGAIGVGGAAALTDGVDAYYRNKTDGLVLLREGAHLKEGTHKVVISDQFYELLTYETTEQDQTLAMNGIKTACNTLNENVKGVQFELCTTVKECAEKYSLKQVESVEQGDITFYLTRDILCNNPNVLGDTVWDIEHFSRELKDLNITFVAKAMFTVWSLFPEDKEVMDPLNSYAYTITVHEMMHAMGFAHQEEKDSIMYAYLSYKSPKDLTEKDKQMLAKYDEVFYNIKHEQVADDTAKVEKSYTTLDNVNNEEIDGLVF